MTKVHTHYDNLKVARNASAEEIRRAYRSLCQRYHPDKNPDDPNSVKAFQFINKAYDVLSKPRSRAKHDLWICQQEYRNKAKQKKATVQPINEPVNKTRAKQKPQSKAKAETSEQHNTDKIEVVKNDPTGFYKSALGVTLVALLLSWYTGHYQQPAAQQCLVSNKNFIDQQSKEENRLSAVEQKPQYYLRPQIARSKQWIEKNIF